MAAYPSKILLSSLDGTNGFTINGIAADDRSGYSVASAGDINGDGFDDVIVGAPYANGYSIGEAYVVFGKAAGFAANIDLANLNVSDGFTIGDFVTPQKGGYSVSSAGDVNGDGIDDLIVGAPYEQGKGGAYVIFGKAGSFGAGVSIDGLNASQGFHIGGIDQGDYAGNWVSAAGDINGDGIDDLIIGASHAANGTGEAYVVFGRTSGFGTDIDLSSLDGTTGFRVDGKTSGGFLGVGVDSAGDVNGDGINDLVIGAYHAGNDPGTGGGTDTGETYVVFGTTAGFDSSLDVTNLLGGNGFTIVGANQGDRSGVSVASAGDVNADGFADVIVGADDVDGNAGAAYVIFGKGTGFTPRVILSALDPADGFVINGIDSGDHVGFVVDSAGDFNGDGFDDLLIGSNYALGIAGTSYVVFGKAGGFGAGINLSSLNGDNGFRLDGVDVGDFAGRAVAAAGDVNGDGFADLIIGADHADKSAGDSHVIFGFRPQEAVTINGTDIANHINGGIGGDSIDANGGNDTVNGWEGNDTVHAGAGNDFVDGGDGKDQIDVGTGADTVLGGDGNDHLVDNSLADDGNVMAGGNGDDIITGAFGADAIDGDSGFDQIEGLDGGDVIRGGLDTDVIFGGNDNDKIFGDQDLRLDQAGNVVDFAANNRDLDQALVIDGTFALKSDPDVEQSDTRPHATVFGQGAGIHFYAFTGQAGDVVTLDIDDSSAQLNTTIRLLDGAGKPLFFNDDQVPADPGSATGDDSFLTFGLQTTGTFIVAVSQFSNDTLFAPLDANDSFTLHVSLDNPSATFAGGSDIIDGGTGDDLMLGEAGDDTLTDLDGGNDTINGGVGNDNMFGGSGDDLLLGAAGDDTLDGGSDTDTLNGGAGSDLLDFKTNSNNLTIALNANGDGTFQSKFGNVVSETVNAISIERIDVGSGDDSVSGGAAGNVFNGNGGSDVLAGNAGNDTLNAGGNDGEVDTLNGGKGDDILIVSDGDQVIELDKQGFDTVRMNGGGLFQLGDGQSVEALETDDANSKTAVDIIGNELSQTVTGNLGKNILVGQSGNDTVIGLAGNDQLDGTDGNDFLDGGKGADGLIGGLGDDTFIVDNPGDTVGEFTGEGFDFVASVGSFVLTAGAEVEQLSTTDDAGTKAVKLTGNEFTQSIFGNAGNNVLSGLAGEDTLDGGTGKDTLTGGADNDSMIGGAGTDLVNWSAATGDINFFDFEFGDSATGFVAGIGDDTISGVENIISGKGNDVLAGSGLANAFSGANGNDTLAGGAGNDKLDGGNGNDKLAGGADKDILNGGRGSDTADWSSAGGGTAASGGIRVVLGAQGQGIVAGDGIGKDSFTGIENVIGGSLGDAIIGNQFANRLDGGAGNDRLTGGLGDDTYVVDSSADRIVEAANQGTDTLLVATGSFALTEAHSIEIMATTDAAGTVAINLSGNGLAQTLAGNAGVNVLSGLGGNDTITASAGDDTLNGGAGDDFLNGGLGNDNMRGGTGNDLYVVNSKGDVVVESAAGSGGTDLVQSTVNFTLGSHVENLTLIGNGNTSGTGNAAGNVIVGNGGNNVLFGNAGDDSISGGDGTDVLCGGLGHDTMRGGDAADAFLFLSNPLDASNVDRILDFEVAIDTIRLKSTVFTGLPLGNLADSAFQIGAADDGQDRILYNSSTGALSFDADGNGAQAAHRFATLDTGLTLTNLDFLVV